MADTILDRDVLVGIGTKALAESGFDPEVLKQWRRRGIPWKDRPVVRDLARETGVDLPADFDRVQRPTPKFAKRKRKAKSPSPKKRAERRAAA